MEGVRYSERQLYVECMTSTQYSTLRNVYQWCTTSMHKTFSLSNYNIGNGNLLFLTVFCIHGVLHSWEFVFFQYFRKARESVARMQEQGLVQLDAKLQLRKEPLLLVRVRRIVAVEVQAAFADRHHVRLLREHAQRCNGGLVAFARVVRVDASGREHGSRVRIRSLQRCHAFGNRRTARTEVMFSEGGRAYIYLCYGIHHLFNVVTGPEGMAHAVLVRAVQPADNVEAMLARRGMFRLERKLTAGPGALSQALGLNTQHSGLSLLDPASV